MLGFGSSSKRERTHVYVSSIAERNAYPPSLRDWGMIITVINYPASGDTTDFQLTFSAGASISDNANFIEFTGGGSGSSSNAEYFTGDGVTTNFVLTAVADVKIGGVFVGGLRVKEGTHYTKNDTTKTVTFLTAVNDGDDVDIEYFSDLTVGGSGASDWGDLGGTVTDQADLVAYIATQIAALEDSSPAALDTLNELAAALGDDANFATTVTNALAAKQALVNSATALVDGASIDLTAIKHTLASSSATRTFTISYTGDDITLEVTLSATSATYTFPATALCTSEGVSSGDNLLALAGVSGDKYIIAIKKIGSAYYVVSKNFGQ